MISTKVIAHEKKFSIEENVFIMLHTGKRIFRNSSTFLGFHVFKDTEKQTPYVGFAYDKKDAINIANNFLKYSFCKILSEEFFKRQHQKVIFPWCIRKLTKEGRSFEKKRPFRIDTLTLCGKDTKNFHDLSAPVSLEFNGLCDECAWIYWTSHWKK